MKLYGRFRGRRWSLTIIPGLPWRRRRLEDQLRPVDVDTHAWAVGVAKQADDPAVPIVTYRCARKERTGRIRWARCRTCGDLTPTG